MKLSKFVQILSSKANSSVRMSRNTNLKRFFSEESTTADAGPVRIAFSPEELQQLESENVSKAWFQTIISKFQDNTPEIYERLNVQLDHLFEGREELPLLRKELESVRQINTINHQKVSVVRHKIEDLDKEMNSMQARISKEIAQEKEHSLKNFAHEAVNILNTLKAGDAELNSISTKVEQNEANYALHSFVAGFKMIENSGNIIFKRYDIHPIEITKDGAFNKALHEVDGNSDEKALEAGSIKEVIEPGYLIGKNVLKKAKVQLK
jgi:molecular chaperone GrpE (heat shock protein)